MFTFTVAAIFVCFPLLVDKRQHSTFEILDFGVLDRRSVERNMFVYWTGRVYAALLATGERARAVRRIRPILVVFCGFRTFPDGFDSCLKFSHVSGRSGGGGRTGEATPPEHDNPGVHCTS